MQPLPRAPKARLIDDPAVRSPRKGATPPDRPWHRSVPLGRLLFKKRSRAAQGPAFPAPNGRNEQVGSVAQGGVIPWGGTDAGQPLDR